MKKSHFHYFIKMLFLILRKAGEASAYSVFNENCEAIDGTMNAQHFERDLMGKRN